MTLIRLVLRCTIEEVLEELVENERLLCHLTGVKFRWRLRRRRVVAGLSVLVKGVVETNTETTIASHHGERAKGAWLPPSKKAGTNSLDFESESD